MAWGKSTKQQRAALRRREARRAAQLARVRDALAGPPWRVPWAPIYVPVIITGLEGA
jgi:hypothetical protein